MVPVKIDFFLATRVGYITRMPQTLNAEDIATWAKLVEEQVEHLEAREDTAVKMIHELRKEKAESEQVVKGFMKKTLALEDKLAKLEKDNEVLLWAAERKEKYIKQLEQDIIGLKVGVPRERVLVYSWGREDVERVMEDKLKLKRRLTDEEWDEFYAEAPPGLGVGDSVNYQYEDAIVDLLEEVLDIKEEEAMEVERVECVDSNCPKDYHLILKPYPVPRDEENQYEKMA